MKRLVGFALICIAIGMILAIILPYLALEILLIIVGIMAGYHLFCC